MPPRRSGMTGSKSQSRDHRTPRPGRTARRRSVSAGSQLATRRATPTSATRSADLCDRIASTVAMRLAHTGGTRPEQQRSLGSERGLATPSPDGKGEIPLGPSLKIMPVDSYSTLGRSCEPAFKWIFWPSPNGRCAACHTLAGGWSAPGGQEASCSFTCPGSSPEVQSARSRA